MRPTHTPDVPQNHHITHSSQNNTRVRCKAATHDIFLAGSGTYILALGTIEPRKDLPLPPCRVHAVSTLCPPHRVCVSHSVASFRKPRHFPCHAVPKETTHSPRLVRSTLVVRIGFRAVASRPDVALFLPSPPMPSGIRARPKGFFRAAQDWCHHL